LAIELLPDTTDLEECLVHLERLDEQCRDASMDIKVNKRCVKVHYDKFVCPRQYAKGDLVLLYDQAKEPLGPGKFNLGWHDPYIVQRVLEIGAYELEDYEPSCLGVSLCILVYLTVYTSFPFCHWISYQIFPWLADFNGVFGLLRIRRRCQSSYTEHGTVYESKGQLVSSGGICLEPSTNNVAEYNVVIELLHDAISHGVRSLEVLLDSQLVVCQLNDIYYVRDPTLLRRFLWVRLLG
jgi:hypothetical protein